MNIPERILIIDDEPTTLSLISAFLKNKGYQVLTAKDGTEGVDLAKTEKPDLVVTDYQMPGLSGLDVLEKIKEIDEDIPVVILTAHGDASLTIKSIQTGAFDFITKPVRPNELIEIVENGISIYKSLKQSATEKAKTLQLADDNLMAGNTPALIEIFKTIARISQNNLGVLITGENDTGKKRLARLTHQSAFNKDEPLVYLNCHMLRQDQTGRVFSEGEEFENEKSNRLSLRAKLREAKNGTVILDGIDTISLPIQARLLDIINEFSTDNIQLSASHPRFISLAIKDVGSMVHDGNFLKELYYKLRVFSVYLPPLRERMADLPTLVDHLIEELNPVLGKKISNLEDGVLETLKSHHWPGNTGELKNVLMEAMVLSHGALIEKKHINIAGTGLTKGNEAEITVTRSPGEKPVEEPLLSLAEVEKEHIAKILKITGGNKQRTASILGITRPTLNAKITKYGLM